MKIMSLRIILKDGSSVNLGMEIQGALEQIHQVGKGPMDLLQP
jgi:hypothetical protein